MLLFLLVGPVMISWGLADDSDLRAGCTTLRIEDRTETRYLLDSTGLEV